MKQLNIELSLQTEGMQTIGTRECTIGILKTARFFQLGFI